MAVERADVVVVGGGIIGLATARALTARRPGLRLVVLEAEQRTGTHQSGHNSGVLHAGVYYRPGSLKAKLAVAGREQMVAFCRNHGVAHEVCGKLIVAVDESERPRLEALAERAVANGVPAELVSAAAVRELEPHCAAVAGLRVHSTGIADYGGVCAALEGDVVAAGGEVRTGARVVALNPGSRGQSARVTTEAAELEAEVVVNCAGLRSDQVAGLVGASEGHRIVPFRGEYYELTPRARHLVNGLIYPVPDPAFPFLGVHLTRMIDSEVHAGPNAVLALHREGYRWRDVSRRQVLEHLSNRGLWKLARRYWRTGAGEVWRSLSKTAFAAALARLVPEISAADIQRSPAGVRAQAMDADGELVDDFAVTRKGRTVHVLNAPSPAATASLAIAEMIAGEVEPLLAA